MLKSFKNISTKKNKKHKSLGIFVVLPIFVVVSYVLMASIYIKRIYPGVNVAGVYVGSKTIEGAEVYLAREVIPPDSLKIYAKGKVFEIAISDIDFSYDIEDTINKAFALGRSGNPLLDSLLTPKNIFSPKNIPLTIRHDKQKLDEYLQVIANELSVEPIPPTVNYTDKKIVVEKGKTGEKADLEKFKKMFSDKLSLADFSETEITFEQINNTLTDQEVLLWSKRSEALIGKSLVLKNEYDLFAISDKTLITFVDPKGSYSEPAISDYIEKNITGKVNRPPQNASFMFEDGKAQEFLPAKDGLVVNSNQLKDEVVDGLSQLENSDQKSREVIIPVFAKSPDITLQDVNNMGIKELIGRGTSVFKGSIAGRVYNIGLASSKLNGVLVAPGETFSFNNAVGDVSALTGYKQAYVIKDGKTVLGDGGGLCQVSTTLFRAVLKAGLPVLERRAHSYRVGYYEQDSSPGLDATVFSPSTDFKFKNDTPNHLLIQTIFNKEKLTLVFEIYGTSDGRIATTTKPVVSSSIAPLEDLYVDDPTLPAGKINQIEHKAWGAKVSFNYKVERNGETIYEKKFLSNYQPWQAVYLRGTAPIN